MSDGWIDSTGYFGPCRRCARAGLRFNERRREDLAGEPPSVASVLRRLRVQLADVTSEERRVTFLVHLHAAVSLAEALHLHDCSEKLIALAEAAATCALGELEQALDNGLSDAMTLT